MIFENIRYGIAKVLLRRKAKKVKREKMLFDFASAKYVGILCSPQNEADTALIKEFLHNISQKGIKYLVLGYFDGKSIPENFLYLKGIDFITQQDINFLMKPNGEMIDKFIGEPFDILINCIIDSYFSVEYISQLSIAKFKVGIMRDGESYYDLMIDISKEKTIKYFLNNLEIYLSNLRNPHLE